MQYADESKEFSVAARVKHRHVSKQKCHFISQVTRF